MHNNLQYYGLTILLSSQLSTLYSVFKLLTYNNNNNHFILPKINTVINIMTCIILKHSPTVTVYTGLTVMYSIHYYYT